MKILKDCRGTYDSCFKSRIPIRVSVLFCSHQRIARARRVPRGDPVRRIRSAGGTPKFRETEFSLNAVCLLTILTEYVIL